jgi:hypothetical protein
MHGPTWIFWANLTSFSLKSEDEPVVRGDLAATAYLHAYYYSVTTLTTVGLGLGRIVVSEI